jgi:hypothetical protein
MVAIHERDQNVPRQVIRIFPLFFTGSSFGHEYFASVIMQMMFLKG